MKDLSIFTVAFLFGFCLTPLAIQLAKWFKILDYPESRKVHDQPTPLLGGVAIFTAFFFMNYPFIPPQKPFLGVYLGATLIFLGSLWEDIRELSVRARLLLQSLGAVIMLLFGVKVSFLTPGLWGDVGEIFITLLWIVGITNAMNFLDGLDGLLPGLCVITGLFFYAVAHQVNQLYFGLLTLAMAGVCLGFLPHNFPVPFRYLKRLLKGEKRCYLPTEDRAQIFLGDSGSTFLGAFFAGISVMGDLASHNMAALAVPILLLGIPIFDITFITIRRILEGRVKNIGEWLGYAGKDHFHHRLMDLGFSKPGSVFFIHSVAVTLGITALVLRNAGPLDTFLLLVKAALIFFLIALLMLAGIRSTKRG